MYYSCNLDKYKNKKECKKLLNTENSEQEEKSLAKQLYILQVQIINKLLKIFLTLTENIENGFHIKFKINLFKNKLRQRNLQESSETQEVDLYLDNVSDDVVTLTIEIPGGPTVTNYHPIDPNFIAGNLPTTQGTYVLKCTVDSEGNATVAWVAEV